MHRIYQAWYKLIMIDTIIYHRPAFEELYGYLLALLNINEIHIFAVVWVELSCHYNHTLAVKVFILWHVMFYLFLVMLMVSN